jgi:hypothetical protein
MLPRIGVEGHPFPRLREQRTRGENPSEGAIRRPVLRSEENMADGFDSLLTAFSLFLFS